MESTQLFGTVVEFDPVCTAEGYEVLDPPDPDCCDACSEFDELVARDMLPASFEAGLRRLGIHPGKPQEVYGGPEAQFLGGWYAFVGKLPTHWSGEGDGAFQEVVPGFRCWITDHVTRLNWPASLGGLSLLQVEFEWRVAASDSNRNVASA